LAMAQHGFHVPILTHATRSARVVFCIQNAHRAALRVKRGGAKPSAVRCD